jgi:hypothetical protein
MVLQFIPFVAAVALQIKKTDTALYTKLIYNVCQYNKTENWPTLNNSTTNDRYHIVFSNLQQNGTSYKMRVEYYMCQRLH